MGGYHGLSRLALIMSYKRKIEDFTRGEGIVTTEARYYTAGYEDGGRVQESRNVKNAVLESGEETQIPSQSLRRKHGPTNTFILTQWN